MTLVWVLPLVLAVALGGCTAAGRVMTDAPPAAAVSYVGEVDASSLVARQGSKRMPASLASGVTQEFNSIDNSGEQYRLAPYDILSVGVFNVPELTGEFQIAPDGRVSLPLIGNIEAAGKTTQQLQQRLTADLGNTYLQSPQVNVAVKEYKSQRVTVEGAVAKPGVFEMNGQTTLLQAVAMAEGATRYAEPENVIIFRREAGQRYAARFDIIKIRAGKLEDPLLRAGDVVVVAESGSKTAVRDIIQFLPLAGAFALIL